MKNTQAYTNLTAWKESLELVKSTYILTNVSFLEMKKKRL